MARDARRLALGERAPQVEARPAELERVAVRVAALDGRAERREQLLAGHADPVRPHAPGALLAEQRLAEVEDRRAEPHSASRARPRRRRARRPRRSSATARRRRSRTCRCAWSWMRSTSTRTTATRSPSVLDDRAPDRGQRDVPGGEDRQRAARVLAQPRQRLAPQRQREHERPRPAPDRGRDRDRVRLARRRSRAPRRSRRATSGSSSMPRGYAAAARRPLSRAAGWPARAARRWTCSTDAAPTSRLTRALIVRCASPVRRAIVADQRVRSARRRSRRSNAVSGSTAPTAAAGVVVNAASAGETAGGAGSANSCSASPGCVVCSTSSSRRALDHSARNGLARLAALAALGDRLARGLEDRARGCAPPRSRPRAASAAGPTAGRRATSAPWAPACGG